MIKPDQSLHIYLRMPFEFHEKAQGENLILLLQGVFVPLGQILSSFVMLFMSPLVCIQNALAERERSLSMSISVKERIRLHFST